MKKFLFLDDDDARHESFDKIINRIEVRVDHVHSVPELIEKISNETYDCVFLDHDLGPYEQYGGTGTEAAMAIVNLPMNVIPKNIIIHSWNPDGALRMESILRGYVKNISRIPFSFDEEN